MSAFKSVEIRLDPRSAKIMEDMMYTEDIARRVFRQTFYKFGRDLRKTTSQEIRSGVKSGRVYLIRARGGRLRRHQSSAPGQTHANLTGALLRSIGYKVQGTDRLDFGYGVSGTTDPPDYGPSLEEGTRTMAPRPSLQNGSQAVLPRIQGHFDQALQDERYRRRAGIGYHGVRLTF